MKYQQLTMMQRYQIFLLLKHGMSHRQIAQSLNVAPSTISPEIERNRCDTGHYCPDNAHNFAHRRRHLARKRQKPEYLKLMIETLLALDWSPEQIAGFLCLFRKSVNQLIMNGFISMLLKTSRAAAHCTCTYVTVLSVTERGCTSNAVAPLADAQSISDQTSLRLNSAVATGNRIPSSVGTEQE